MINQEYLVGNFFRGAGLPVHGVRSFDINPRRIEYERGDFSFLLKLEELQRPRSLAIEHVSVAEASIFENQRPLNQGLPHANSAAAFSLEEFERDMDLLAEGLEHLPIHYRGTYSREDIYLDDE